jgi:hypothetical protein
VAPLFYPHCFLLDFVFGSSNMSVDVYSMFGGLFKGIDQWRCLVLPPQPRIILDARAPDLEPPGIAGPHQTGSALF